MLSDDRLRRMAERLVTVPGVVGVTLGGSRARGQHAPDSDVDLGVYYRGQLDVDALGALARDVAGPAAQVTRPGAWGPWVDGGAWLDVDGTPVDWIYRDLERVRACCGEARLGRFAFHFQVGHPLGVPDLAYAGELAVGRSLADPGGELARLRTQVTPYPPALAEALVARLDEAEFLLGGVRKALSRADTAYVAGCLFRVVGLCAHALHGRAGQWLINEKGAVASAGCLPQAPAEFAARAHGVLADLGTSPEELRAAVDDAVALVADVRLACVPR